MYPHTVKENGLFKTYVHAREYQRKIHHKNLGRALYENDNRNMFMLGSRGFGKSYSVGVGVVLHEFLFDGLTEYTEDTLRNPGAAEIVVGAGDAKYSADILSKTRASLERLPGSVEIGGKYYPSPFSKQYSGS